MARVFLGENPAVVGLAGLGAGPLVRLHRRVEMKVVGGVRGIAEKDILLQRGLLHAAINPPHGAIAAQDGEDAVLHLLERVGLAIGHVNLGSMAALIDGRVVVVQVESLVSAGQNGDLVGLRFDAEIAVAGVVPATLIEAGNRLAGLVFCQRRSTLLIAVEMVVAGERHARIVQVAGAVPDAVLLLHAHVAHLHGEEIFQDGLPDAALVDVRRDPEWLRDGIAEGHLIHAGLVDPGEVELGVFVAKEIAPDRRPRGKDLMRAAGGLNAQHAHGIRHGVLAIHLDNGELLLRGVVPDLAHVDHRLVLPAGDGVRGDDPVDGVFGGAGRHQRAHHEPAVVPLGAGIQQLQIAGLRLDDHALGAGLGSDGEPRTGG